MKAAALKKKIFGIDDRLLSFYSILLALMPYNFIPFLYLYFSTKGQKNNKTMVHYYSKNFLNFGIQLAILTLILFWTEVVYLLVAILWYLTLVFSAIAAYEGKKFKFIIFYPFLK